MYPSFNTEWTTRCILYSGNFGICVCVHRWDIVFNYSHNALPWTHAHLPHSTAPCILHKYNKILSPNVCKNWTTFTLDTFSISLLYPCFLHQLWQLFLKFDLYWRHCVTYDLEILSPNVFLKTEQLLLWTLFGYLYCMLVFTLQTHFNLAKLSKSQLEMIVYALLPRLGPNPNPNSNPNPNLKPKPKPEVQTQTQSPNPKSKPKPEPSSGSTCCNRLYA